MPPVYAHSVGKDRSQFYLVRQACVVFEAQYAWGCYDAAMKFINCAITQVPLIPDPGSLITQFSRWQKASGFRCWTILRRFVCKALVSAWFSAP